MENPQPNNPEPLAPLPVKLTPKYKMEPFVMPSSLEGQTLGKYRLLNSLGRGGMAQVYRAYHPQMDRYVAVKVLRSDLVEDEEFLARFKREAQAVGALRHPNIVQVFDFDVESDVYFMVMELLEGNSLKARLNYWRGLGKHMPVSELLRILLDVLAGLGHAHEAGIIHRDIKPGNIMLTSKGQAVITDFGIAQIVGGTHHTVTGALMGTLNYMAPEQGYKGETSAQSDIYSLGVVLFEMLTGRPPFDADTPLAILMKHINDPLPLPRTIDPDIPMPLERIVLKALAKQPEDRFESAKSMAKALSEAMGEMEVELPTRLYLKTVVTEMEAAEGAVGVYSGAQRENLTGEGFANDDTDITFGSQVKKVDLAEAFEKEVDVPIPTLQPAPAAADPGATRVSPPASPPPASWAADFPQPKRTPSRGYFVRWMGLLIGYNIWAVVVSALSGSWALFQYAWPVELMLVGLGFILAMVRNGHPMLTLMAGVIGGNGVLMAFYALTGQWNWWRFLWPLEPILVIGVVVMTIQNVGKGDEGRAITKKLGEKWLYITAAVIFINAFGVLIFR